MPHKCLCGKSQSSFNVKGGKPVCCTKCKTPEMVDVVSKRCLCGKSQTVSMCLSRFVSRDVAEQILVRCV